MTGPTKEQQILIDALVEHKYDDWYSALLHAAIEETKDAALAVQAANAAFEKNPTDPSKPQDDDADVVFGKKEPTE